MSLKERILADMKSAMREKDTVRLETVRLLRAAVQRREVDERIELDDEGVTQVLQKLVKQSRDAAEQFEKGGRDDLAAKEIAGLEILETYLPAQMSAEELDQLIRGAIDQTGAESMKDMGKVMGIVKAGSQGRADMGAVSSRVKDLLS